MKKNWMKLFFKKIGDSISETPEDQKKDGQENMSNSSDGSGDTSESGNNQDGDAVSKEDNIPEPKEAEMRIEEPDVLVKILCKKIAEHFRFAGSLSEKCLIVWLADNMTFHAYNTHGYKKHIQDALSEECGVSFGSVTFCNGRPADELNCEEVGKSGKVFIEIVNKQSDDENIPIENPVCQEASITIHQNQGSLQEKEYILSIEEMRKNGIDAYNIGVERFPEGEQRENHIVIDGNPDSPMINFNKYVSRSHAHIFYSEKFGFCLQADRGIPKNGKSTCILRRGKPIKLGNADGWEPLEDGDVIVLSDAVRLLYVSRDRINDKN